MFIDPKMVLGLTIITGTILLYGNPVCGFLINTKSISVRNARWLNENRLNWYHSYVPDVVKLLTSGTNDEDDDQKPGFDPGPVPTPEQINLRLRQLCARANVTFSAMNLSRDCAADLRFLVCSGTELTNGLVALGTKYCQKQPTNGQVCQNQVNKLIQTNKWTSEFLDSFGKVSGGLLSGSYMHLGSYQQCTQLRIKKPKASNSLGDFEGKFCHATFSTPLSPTRSALASSCYGKNFTQACAPIDNSYTVKWGFCVPKSCSIREANGMVYYILYATNLTLCPDKPLVMCVETKPLGSDPAAIAMTVICAILALVVIAATLYDLIDRKILTWQWLGCFGGTAESVNYDQSIINEPKGKHSFEVIQSPDTSRRHDQSHYSWYVKVLLAFSVYTNLKNLLKTDDPFRIKCLDGIRVLTMAWVVLAQTHVLMIDYIGNLATFLKTPAILAFQAINNSSFSTDTFFLLAGLLNGYVWLKRPSEEEKRTNVIKRSAFTFLKRLLRLLPVYSFILGLATAFWGLIGEGPMWITARYTHAGPFFCKFTWWTNLLFVNNFFFLDYACMPWTWHIAVDMQLFLLTIPVLILYKKRPLAGFLVSAVLIVLSLVLNGIIVGSYGLSPSVLGSSDLTRLDSINEYYDKIFIKPYMRWNPYFIGIFVGYLLRRTEMRQNIKALKFLQIGPINTACWAAVVAICSSLVYGLYGFASGRQLTSASVIIYASVSRTVWALAVGLLILLCLRTRGGLVKWFLSWSIWIPLSRLTYCAFLLHSLAIVFFYGTAKEWLQYSFGNSMYFWLSSLIISYGLGLIAHVCVEAPAIRIGRLLGDRSTTAEPVTTELLERDGGNSAR